MATELVPVLATTEKALRARIHRLFCGDVPDASQPGVPPHFWVGPTEEQKNTSFLDIHEHIELSDEISVPSEGSPEERQWLNSPHVDLDGISPEAMLTGDIRSRRRLGAFVAAIETAVRKGSFS